MREDRKRAEEFLENIVSQYDKLEPSRIDITVSVHEYKGQSKLYKAHYHFTSLTAFSDIEDLGYGLDIIDLEKIMLEQAMKRALFYRKFQPNTNLFFEGEELAINSSKFTTDFPITYLYQADL